MNLFQLGQFKLHSGAESRWKIDCDALTDEDLDAIALMLAERLPSFSKVEGIPRGGLRLAKAMERYCSLFPDDRLLVVDDVCTTGSSFRKFESDNGGQFPHVAGACIFARGPCPSWVMPLFTLYQSTREKSP